MADKEPVDNGLSKTGKASGKDRGNNPPAPGKTPPPAPKSKK